MTQSIQRTMTPRARRRRARLAAILDAAMGLLVSEGLDGLTIQRLAQAVDYTPGALYRYFDSKDAIIVALQVKAFKEIHVRFEAAWALCDGLAVERGGEGGLSALIKALATARVYIALPELAPEHFALIGVAMGEPRQLLDDSSVGPVISTVMPVLADVGAILERGVEQGVLSGAEPSAARAVTLWSSLHGVLLMKKFSRFDPSLIQARALARGLSLTLLRGWGAPEALLLAAEAEVEALFSASGMLGGR